MFMLQKKSIKLEVWGLGKQEGKHVRPEKNKMDHPDQNLSHQTICKLNQGDSTTEN